MLLVGFGTFGLTLPNPKPTKYTWFSLCANWNSQIKLVPIDGGFGRFKKFSRFAYSPMTKVFSGVKWYIFLIFTNGIYRYHDYKNLYQVGQILLKMRDLFLLFILFLPLLCKSSQVFYSVEVQSLTRSIVHKRAPFLPLQVWPFLSFCLFCCFFS